MPTDPETEKNLNDISWSLGWFDFALDVIASHLTTLKEELLAIDPARAKVFSDFYDVIRFKSSELYSTLMKIEELVLGTTEAFYKKYHGPFREEAAGSVLADAERSLIYSFESFLTQYKSLLDISIKFAFALCSVGQKLPRRIDSFERLVKTIDAKREPYYKIVNDSALFSKFDDERGELQDIKNYRDYIIHHAFLSPEKAAQGVGGHLFFKYWLPTLTQKGGGEYTADTSSQTRLDFFCRKKLYVLFTILVSLTDTLFTDQIKEPHIKALKREDPELVKQILVRIARKEAFADRIMNEGELRAFLALRGIDFGEFVEQSRHSERQSDGMKSHDGRDMSYLLEKVSYKPVGNVRIFKTSYVYDRDWKPPTELEPTYGVVVTGVSVEDFVSGSQDIGRILKHLRGCGLVYTSSYQGAARYASMREDLKGLILSLSDLSQFKWVTIQIPEMKYFRPRTPEETENIRRILGEGADEFLRKEDQERERIQDEYRKWKEQPKHYHEGPLEIESSSRIVQRIFHRDFEAEKKQDFVNWKTNKIVHLNVKKDGALDRVEMQLLPDEMFTEMKLGELITKCQEIWKEEPTHFLDMMEEFLKRDKQQYEEDVKKARARIADIVAKYDYLKPVFASINKDVLQ
jgi:hypothetical protein